MDGVAQIKRKTFARARRCTDERNLRQLGSTRGSTRRLRYGFFEPVFADLRFDGTAVRSAACKTAGELFWLCACVCAACFRLGAAGSACVFSNTPCTPVSVKWSGLTSWALEAGARNNAAAPRPAIMVNLHIV